MASEVVVTGEVPQEPVQEDAGELLADLPEPPPEPPQESTDDAGADDPDPKAGEPKEEETAKEETDPPQDETEENDPEPVREVVPEAVIAENTRAVGDFAVREIQRIQTLQDQTSAVGKTLEKINSDIAAIEKKIDDGEATAKDHTQLGKLTASQHEHEQYLANATPKLHQAGQLKAKYVAMEKDFAALAKIDPRFAKYPEGFAHLYATGELAQKWNEGFSPDDILGLVQMKERAIQARRDGGAQPKPTTAAPVKAAAKPAPGAKPAPKPAAGVRVAGGSGIPATKAKTFADVEDPAKMRALRASAAAGDEDAQWLLKSYARPYREPAKA